MALITNSQTTFVAIGNREDLINDIFDISPTVTPFLSGIARVPAEATNHGWQTDTIGTAAANAQLEGDIRNADAAIPTTRLGNRLQISSKIPSVTRTQRQVNSAGRSNDMDYQLMQKSKLLKNDMEFALLANNAAVNGNATTARELGGIEAWLETNANIGAGGTVGDGGTTARITGTDRNFAQAQLDGVLADCFTEGGNPDTIMVSPAIKQLLSGIVNGGAAGAAQRVVDGNSKTVTTAIDIYVSDFGSLAVVPNRFQVAESMLILDMSMWAVASLTMFEETPLAKLGDGESVLLLSEYTLEARNEAASGIVSDLNQVDA